MMKEDLDYPLKHKRYIHFVKKEKRSWLKMMAGLYVHVY